MRRDQKARSSGDMPVETMGHNESIQKTNQFLRKPGWWIAASFCVATAAAQVTAPSLGYLPMSGKVQPVDGIPSAARLADAVTSPELSLITTAGEVALGVDASTGAVTLISGGQVQAVSGLDPNPTAIALSPSGTVAAAWFAEGRGQAIALDAGAQAQASNVPFLSGAPQSFAVSDEVGGQVWMAGVWSSGAYALGPASKVLALPVNPGVLAFAPFELTLVAADSTTLWELADPSSGFDATAVANLRSWQDDGTTFEQGQRGRTQNRDRVAAPPAGVAMDQQWISAALRNGKVIRQARDAQSGVSPSVSDCHCDPDGLVPLRGPVFRLAGADATQPALVYDPQRDRIWRVQSDNATQGSAR